MKRTRCLACGEVISPILRAGTRFCSRVCYEEFCTARRRVERRERNKQ